MVDHRVDTTDRVGWGRDMPTSAAEGTRPRGFPSGGWAIYALRGIQPSPSARTPRPGLQGSSTTRLYQAGGAEADLNTTGAAPTRVVLRSPVPYPFPERHWLTAHKCSHRPPTPP